MFDLAVIGEVWGQDRTDAGIGPFTLRICSQGRVRTAVSPFGEVAATHGLAGLDGCELVLAPGRDDPLAEVPAVAVAPCAGPSRRATVAGFARARSRWRPPAARRPPGDDALADLDDLARQCPRANLQRDVLYTTTAAC